MSYVHDPIRLLISTLFEVHQWSNALYKVPNQWLTLLRMCANKENKLHANYYFGRSWFPCTSGLASSPCIYCDSCIFKALSFLIFQRFPDRHDSYRGAINRLQESCIRVLV